MEKPYQSGTFMSSKDDAIRKLRKQDYSLLRHRLRVVWRHLFRIPVYTMIGITLVLLPAAVGWYLELVAYPLLILAWVPVMAIGTIAYTAICKCAQEWTPNHLVKKDIIDKL